MRALLVEDEALVAMIAEEALMAMGFSVDVCGSGQEALAAYDREPPSLAVIDIGLPDMRGDDLAKALRARSADLAILMASGYDPTEVAGHFAGDDRVAVVAKPYTEGDLARQISALGLAPVS